MFGRKRKPPAPPKPVARAVAPEPPAPIDADRAVDFLAELLRIYGEHAFDVGELEAEQTRSDCDGWARHLLVGVIPPGREGAEPGAAGRVAERALPRDLPGLRRYFTGHRQLESETVQTSLVDFRETVWAFIQGLRRTITAEEAADRKVSYRMRRLEGAAQRDSFDDLKREALEIIQLLSEVMAERQTRQHRQVTDMGQRLERLRSELDAVREKAARDPLTSLYNRASFDEQLARVVDFSSLLGRTAFLIMLDVDHFKWVNDTYGHPCGDKVLCEIARSLDRGFLRKDDFVARYGGEEFAIVLQEGTIGSAVMLAERSLQAIRELEVHHAGQDLRVTASFGVAALRPGESHAGWLERADRMLYEAKQGGRDRVAADPDDLEAGRDADPSLPSSR